MGKWYKIRIHWSEQRYLDLHRRSASVNHVVTSVATAVSNCNTHKCSIARRQERSIIYFAMSIAKHLMCFTSLTVCGSQYVGESVQPFNKRMNGHRSDLTKKTLLPVSQHFVSPGYSLDDFGRSKFISLTTIQVGKRIKVFGSTSYEHYIRRA
jgi:hypothetical protein